MYNIGQKVVNIHNSIRKERIQSYFQQKRDQLQKQSITSEIKQKNIQKFEQLLQKKDIRKIYQTFQEVTCDVVELVQKNCQRIFQLVYSSIKTKKQSIHILTLLIIYSYDIISLKLQQLNLLTTIQDELQRALCSNNQTLVKLYLWCFKNLISKHHSKFSAQIFIKRFFQPWFQYLYKTPNFIIIIYYVTQNHYVNPQMILPVILKGIQDSNYSTVLSVSYSMILSNLIKISPIQQLSPYINQIFQCLKYLYCKKDIFTTAVRMRSLSSIGQLLDQIPSNKISEMRILQIYESSLKSFFFCMLQVQSIKIKTLVYDFISILIRKCLEIRTQQNNQILRNLCVDEMIQYLISGLQYHQTQILQTILKLLYSLCFNSDPKLKLASKIFRSDIKINLQNLVYHPNQFIRQYSQQLLKISNFYDDQRMSMQ